MQLSPFFKELQQHFSVDFAKNIIKRGKVCTLNGNKTIYEKGDRMMRILMPLVGHFFTRNDNSESNE